MTDYDKLRIEYARLLGEFLGLLEGLDWWELPEALRTKLNVKKAELRLKYGESDEMFG